MDYKDHNAKKNTKKGFFFLFTQFSEHILTSDIKICVIYFFIIEFSVKQTYSKFIKKLHGFGMKLKEKKKVMGIGWTQESNWNGLNKLV